MLRSEGLTELIGDIVLSCTGGSPSNPTQKLCPSVNGCVVSGNGGTGEPFNGADATRPNIFQGVVSQNRMTFLGVPIEAPGATGVRTFRITNVRVNASAVGASITTPSQVVAAVSASGSTSLSLDNPQRIVGYIQSSLAVGAGSISATECTMIANTGQTAGLVFTENFSSAFKTRTVAGADPAGTAVQRSPGVDYNTESGLILPDLPGAGLADFGTRFKAVFRNIPPGVRLWVSTKNVGATDTSMAQFVVSESGVYFPIPSTTTLSSIDVVQVPVVNGNATAVWEVTAASPVVLDTFVFDMFFDSSAALKLNTTAPTANLSYANTTFPGDGTIAQPSSYPVPRFADPSTPSTVISITPCQTTLLFPFVTNQAGLDTGLAISNTSSDPVGTAPQPGICTLSAFGSSAPLPFTTATIAAGTSYTTLVSTLFPNFVGYVFAVCNFQYAHGFAFVSDAGARNLTSGYLALVIPASDGTSVLGRPGAPTGESLAH